MLGSGRQGHMRLQRAFCPRPLVKVQTNSPRKMVCPPRGHPPPDHDRRRPTSSGFSRLLAAGENAASHTLQLVTSTTRKARMRSQSHCCTVLIDSCHVVACCSMASLEIARSGPGPGPARSAAQQTGSGPCIHVAVPGSAPTTLHDRRHHGAIIDGLPANRTPNHTPYSQLFSPASGLRHSQHH